MYVTSLYSNLKLCKLLLCFRYHVRKVFFYKTRSYLIGQVLMNQIYFCDKTFKMLLICYCRLQDILQWRMCNGKYFRSAPLFNNWFHSEKNSKNIFGKMIYTVVFRQVSERKIIFEDGWFFVDSSACSLNFTGLVFFRFFFQFSENACNCYSDWMFLILSCCKKEIIA